MTIYKLAKEHDSPKVDELKKKLVPMKAKFDAAVQKHDEIMKQIKAHDQQYGEAYKQAPDIAKKRDALTAQSDAAYKELSHWQNEMSPIKDEITREVMGNG